MLTRVRGIRGEFVAIPLSYHQERFENLGRVYLFGAGPEPAEREVEWVRSAGPSMSIKFRGIDSIEDAEPWRYPRSTPSSRCTSLVDMLTGPAPLRYTDGAGGGTGFFSSKWATVSDICAPDFFQ